MAVVADKVTEVPSNAGIPAPSPALKRAALAAVYDYYPYGSLMPGRFYEDESDQMLPVTHTVYVMHTSQHNEGTFPSIHIVFDTTWTADHSYVVLKSKLDEFGKDYRFGFNGKMKDNEWAGIGNWQNYGMRMYDPRLARFPSRDPLFKFYPSLTNYQFSSLNPIVNIDLDGLEGINSIKAFLIPAVGVSVTKTVVSQELARQAAANAAIDGGSSATATATAEEGGGGFFTVIGETLGTAGLAAIGTVAGVLLPTSAGKGSTRPSLYPYVNPAKEMLNNGLKKNEDAKNNPYIVLYRGVHALHPDLHNAENGMAFPSGGDADAEQHNAGNYNSIYTSWTFSKSVAQYHANKAGAGGIILEKRFLKSEVVPSPDHFAELEVLVPGVVTGATPEQAKPGGTPSAY